MKNTKKCLYKGFNMFAGIANRFVYDVGGARAHEVSTTEQVEAPKELDQATIDELRGKKDPEGLADALDAALTDATRAIQQSSHVAVMRGRYELTRALDTFQVDEKTRDQMLAKFSTEFGGGEGDDGQVVNTDRLNRKQADAIQKDMQEIYTAKVEETYEVDKAAQQVSIDAKQNEIDNILTPRVEGAETALETAQDGVSTAKGVVTELASNYGITDDYGVLSEMSDTDLRGALTEAAKRDLQEDGGAVTSMIAETPDAMDSFLSKVIDNRFNTLQTNIAKVTEAQTVVTTREEELAREKMALTKAEDELGALEVQQKQIEEKRNADILAINAGTYVITSPPQKNITIQQAAYESALGQDTEEELAARQKFAEGASAKVEEAYREHAHEIFIDWAKNNQDKIGGLDESIAGRTAVLQKAVDAAKREVDKKKASYGIPLDAKGEDAVKQAITARIRSEYTPTQLEDDANEKGTTVDAVVKAKADKRYEAYKKVEKPWTDALGAMTFDEVLDGLKKERDERVALATRIEAAGKRFE